MFAFFFVLKAFLVFIFFAVAKDLVDTIVLFNGGFSCKSFSKLHPDYHSLLTAMQEENQEPSGHSGTGSGLSPLTCLSLGFMIYLCYDT